MNSSDFEAIEDAEIYAQPALLVVPGMAIPEKAREHFRLVAMHLERLLASHASRVVVIASPTRGDGKTTTAIHLGAVLAHDMERRVLLVDGDLRRPRLAQALGLVARRGLCDVLRGAARADEVTWQVDQASLHVLPGTPGPWEAPPSKLGRLLDTLRSEFDYVIVDTPPISESAGASLCARMSSGVLLIVRPGWTPKRALLEAAEALVDAPLLGCVLNDHEGPLCLPAGRRMQPVLPAREPALGGEDECRR